MLSSLIPFQVAYSQVIRSYHGEQGKPVKVAGSQHRHLSILLDLYINKTIHTPI